MLVALVFSVKLRTRALGRAVEKGFKRCRNASRAEIHNKGAAAICESGCKIIAKASRAEAGLLNGAAAVCHSGCNRGANASVDEAGKTFSPAAAAICGSECKRGAKADACHRSNGGNAVACHSGCNRIANEKRMEKEVPSGDSSC